MKRTYPGNVRSFVQPIYFPDHFSQATPYRFQPTVHTKPMSSDNGVAWSQWTTFAKQDSADIEARDRMVEYTPAQRLNIVSDAWAEKQLRMEGQYQKMYNGLVSRLDELLQKGVNFEDPNADLPILTPPFVEWLARQRPDKTSFFPVLYRSQISKMREDIMRRTAGNGETDDDMYGEGYRQSEDAHRAKPINSLVRPMKHFSNGGAISVVPLEQKAKEQAEKSDRRDQYVQDHLEKYGVAPSFEKTKTAFPDTAEPVEQEEMEIDEEYLPEIVPTYGKVATLPTLRAKTFNVSPVKF